MCFDVSLAFDFKMLADLPSGHVSYIHALNIKITLDVICLSCREKTESGEVAVEWGDGWTEKGREREERVWHM